MKALLEIVDFEVNDVITSSPGNETPGSGNNENTGETEPDFS